MGKSCCEAKSAELAKLREKQGTVLKWVLAINAVMFVVEFGFGLLSRSSALMADSLDMFGDAAVYGFSLFALNRGAIGAVALAANATCLFLLYRHRADDINMRSTWLCSRNDIVSNFGVIIAAVLVGLLNSGWPDLVVGVAIAGLFLKSAYEVVGEAKDELRSPVVTS